MGQSIQICSQSSKKISLTLIDACLIASKKSKLNSFLQDSENCSFTIIESTDKACTLKLFFLEQRTVEPMVVPSVSVLSGPSGPNC